MKLKMLPIDKKLFFFLLWIGSVSISFDSYGQGNNKSAKQYEVSEKYIITDTRQTDCYSAEGNIIAPPSEGQPLFGQDAQYKGIEPSFKNNNDGTVTDLNTGLMWQQIPSSNKYSWQEAVDYCNTLKLGGFDDWRAPSVKELFSISDFSKGWPYLNTDFFNTAENRMGKDQQYWSNNYYHVGTTHNGQGSAFGVNHATGHIKTYPATGRGRHVRAVRGEIYGTNDFVDNKNGTISDRATGLMWMQSDLGLALDWENALKLADTISHANYNDWRLPNVKELQSIVDYSGIFPAIDPLFKCTEITNEAGVLDYGYYWTSTSAYFSHRRPEYYYAWYVAFGRAVDPDGEDSHGAGAARFATKVKDDLKGEGSERFQNYIRLVRSIQ